MVNMNNEENAIVQNDELINKKTKSVPRPEERRDVDTDGSWLNNITDAAINSKLDMSTLNSFSQTSQSREQMYSLLDTMCEDSTIAAILETYAEDATEYNDNGNIVWAEADDSNVGKYITYLLDTMQVDKHIYEWVYSLCKYGDVYLQLYKESEFDDDPFFGKNKDKKPLNEDIIIKAYKSNDKYVHYVEQVSNPAEMYELTRFGKTVGYIKADVKFSNNKYNGLTQNYYKYRFKQGDVTLYDATKFVHASLTDNSDRHDEEVSLFINDEALKKDDGVTYTVRRGQSLFYNVFKIWRELTLLENSMLLNRITKSSIVRIINVEVGDMPKEMVGPHLQGIKALMEQKAAINEGNSIQEYTNPGPIENNIYVPINNGKGAITTDQVGGDVNISQIPDIEYFQNKFFGAMRIPKQYFGLTEDGAGFNGGESLAIISSRYAKMIKRIQNSIIQAITSAINLMLIDKGLNQYINKFTIKMQPPTTQEEVDRRENTTSKIQIVSDVMNLVSDIEDPTTKLKILKSLLSSVISDPEVISLLQDEISRLEDQGIDNNPDSSLGDEDSSNIDLGGSSEPLNLDAELGLEEPTEEIEEEGETLPTPEEIGVDMTDNDIEDNAQ